MTRTVLVTDHVFATLEPERSALGRIGYSVREAHATDEPSLRALAGEAAAILVCYAQLPATVVRAAAEGGARVIARYGIGVDNVDVEAAAAAGVLVTNVPDYCVDEVADHTLALLLAAARGLAPAAADVRAGGWSAPPARVHRLRGRRLAVIGLGRIGRAVAERARPFGFSLVGFDPLAGPVEGVERAETLTGAIADADIISLHLPLTAATRHLIDAEALAGLRRAPLLVNTSRGGLIDLDAALAALDRGTLGGLALDVVESEPPPADHPVRSHPRVVLTPHMAFHSVEAGRELQQRAVDEVVRALTGKPPRSPVTLPA